MSSAFAVQRKRRTATHSDESSAKRSSEFSRSSSGLPLFLQKKLAVSEAGDTLEQEADRMADAVVSGSAVSGSVSFSDAAVQRKCACGGSSSGECEQCRKQREEQSIPSPMLQRSATNDAAAGAEAPPVVHETLAARGEPLDSSVRPQMESRFGRDFGDVRIHTDAYAARSAQAVHSLAYTAGNDVVFAPGQYSPQSSAGKKLLAHELAHVVQQASSSAPIHVSRQVAEENAQPQVAGNQAIPQDTASQNCGRNRTVLPSPGNASNYVVLKQGATVEEGMKYVKNIGKCSVYLHGLYPSVPEDAVEVKPGDTVWGYVPHKGSTMIVVVSDNTCSDMSAIEYDPCTGIS